MKLIKKFLKDHRGQSLVEFALVLPILVFLLFAIMEGGLIFAGYLELENAARDGARYAAIHSDEFDNDTIAAIEGGDFSSLGSISFTLLKPAKFIELEQLEGLEETEKKQDMLFETKGQEKWVKLTLRYPMTISTPLISNLIDNPFILKTSMAMRVE